MATRRGYIGTGGETYFNLPVSINISIGAHEVPGGELRLENMGTGANWKCTGMGSAVIMLLLCDRTGSNAVDIGHVMLSGGDYSSVSVFPLRGLDLSRLKGKDLCLRAMGDTSRICLEGATPVTIEVNTVEWQVMTSATGGGWLQADKEYAAAGETVTLTRMPDDAYYRFVRYTSIPNVTITNNKFAAPGTEVSITAEYEWVEYNVTCSTTGGGWLKADKARAAAGDTVHLIRMPDDAYYRFVRYTTSPEVTITNNSFTMPPSAITVTAVYERVKYNVTCKSTTGGWLQADKAQAAAGETVTLTKMPDDAYYRFVRYTASPNVTITNNRFTMPTEAVTVTAVYERIEYTVTCKANGGTLTADKQKAGKDDQVTLFPVANGGYTFNRYETTPTLTINSQNEFTMPASAVTITAWFDVITYPITVNVTPSGSGTLSATMHNAAPGQKIKLTPAATAGWKLKKITSSPYVNIDSSNTFAMPSRAVTVTAEFEKITYTISKASNPAAGGMVTLNKSSAVIGDTITYSQTPNTGYYFKGWTFAGVSASGGSFTMPPNNVSITANYLKRSTAAMSSQSVTSGGSVTMTITTESDKYTHKYKLSFGQNMETELTNVAAGVKSVTIQIPENWSNQIPNAESKTGGTLLLETYSGSTKIGEYTITGLVFNIQAGYVPTVSDITTDIIRTINGVTYPNIGDLYVQSHCGVRIQATSAGDHGSTIANMTVKLSGYTGANYQKTVQSGTLDFTTGLLTVAGSITITVTAEDSRGRRTTKTKKITVTEYNAPAGSLTVKRCDVNGDDDPNGTYGKYQITKRYSQIGNNALTVSLESQGSTETISADSGNILPGTRQMFNIMYEYKIKLTLMDSMNERTVITATLSSAKFIIHVSADGKKLGLMKAVTKTIPAGKNATIELSGDAQIYIGDETIEEFITRVAGS